MFLRVRECRVVWVVYLIMRCEMMEVFLSNIRSHADIRKAFAKLFVARLELNIVSIFLLSVSNADSFGFGVCVLNGNGGMS